MILNSPGQPCSGWDGASSSSRRPPARPASSPTPGARYGNSIANELTSSADRCASSPRWPAFLSSLRTLIETGTPRPSLSASSDPAGAFCLSSPAQHMRSQSHCPIDYLPAANQTAPSPLTSLTAASAQRLTASGRLWSPAMWLDRGGEMDRLLPSCFVLFLTLLASQTAECSYVSTPLPGPQLVDIS